MEVLQDTESEPLRYKPGGRLDMNHGFLHHIRRNQIARDDYDKEVKQAKEQQKRRMRRAPPRGPRRPDREVYHLRARNGSEAGPGVGAEDWNESGSSTEQETTGSQLFWLDYQADNGVVTSFIVYKEEEPESVVERVEEKNVLDVAMRAVLLARIEQEMDKRRNKR
ncbi:UPF0561 protein C2orf68 homolog [Brachyhypopomus gauderio]|uniref:UPF0561 protein C2orf68 homolog n=1 Tax=Brachyhypopomus gauderio TaxID=698409 RepID=UPI004042A837